MINPTLKESFLIKYEGGTKDTYRYALTREEVREEETRLNKDLSEFTYLELDKLFTDCRHKTYYSAQYQLSIILSYIKFAYANKHINAQTFSMSGSTMFSGEHLKRYIDMGYAPQKYLTTDELDDLIGYCHNAQDAVIFSLLREGVMGEKMQEIRNLRKQDMDVESNNLLLFKDDGTHRYLEVSPECIQICLKAHRQTDYLNGNGLGNPKNKEFELVDGDYIVRPTAFFGRLAEEKASYDTVRQRMTKLKKFWGNPYLTPISIRESGMIEYAKRIIKERKLNQLENKHYKEILERFGNNKNLWFYTKKKIEEYVAVD